MSKGLEALYDLVKNPFCIELGRVQGKKHFTTNFRIIETELKRLKELEKAYDLVVDGLYKASEKQEKQDKKIKELKSSLNRACKLNEEYCETLNKQDQILLIIKEHIVKIGGYKGNFENGKNEILISLKDLTKEEFDLLKEVLL